MTRIRLTESARARARFPDIGTRLGTVLEHGTGTARGWCRVAWPYRQGATRDEDVLTCVWLPRADLEDAPTPETPPENGTTP